jgi:hypothetical protein
VQLDQVAHDREPETEAAVGAGGRRVGLPEALEDVRQEGGIDATAAVRDPDLRVRVHPIDTDDDPPVPRRQLHGVGEQVPDHLLQPGQVARDGAHHLLGNEDLELDALRIRGVAHALAGAVDHVGEIQRPDVQSHLARDDA